MSFPCRHFYIKNLLSVSVCALVSASLWQKKHPILLEILPHIEEGEVKKDTRQEKRLNSPRNCFIIGV